MGIIINWIKEHWNGKTEFIWLLLVNLLLVQIVVYGFGFILSDAPNITWFSYLFGLVVVFIWQLVGAVRHANEALFRPEGIYVVGALFLAFVFLCAAIFGQVGDRYRLLATPIERPYVDPSLVPLPMSPDGSEIYMKGPITLKMYTSFKGMKNHNSLKRVVLDSDGGNVFAARGLLRIIEERGLDTFVSGKCFSACTLVFMGGKRRSSVDDAVFGYHGYSYILNGNILGVDVEAQQNKDRVLFEERGVPTGFMNRVFETPSDDLWRPSHKELTAANILN